MSNLNVDSAAEAAENGQVSAAALKSRIESAVKALVKYKVAQSQSADKPQLLPQEDYIYLNVTLNKIPSNRPRTSPFRIPLPYPLLEIFSSQVCLILDDRVGSPTPDSASIKKVIKSQDIPISKVIRLSKLKANYKPFESKRKLCDSYDMFLVDKRITHLLPKLLGKEFFKKKKLPLGVDLSKKNLKSQVERALGCGLFYMRSGTCCVMKVGKMDMENNQIVENVVDAIKGAVSRVPKKWDGVRSLHLKFSDSVALPIYQAMPNVRLRIDGSKTMKDDDTLVKSLSDGEVVITKEVSGEKTKKKNKKKGRIHEVRYMDVGEDIEDNDDDLDEVEESAKAVISNGEALGEVVITKEVSGEKTKKKNKKKGRIHEVRYMDVGEDIENNDDDLDEVEESAKAVISNGEALTEKKRKKAAKLLKKVSEKSVKSKDAKRKKRSLAD